jgi:hypothetical protein
MADLSQSKFFQAPEGESKPKSWSRWVFGRKVSQSPGIQLTSVLLSNVRYPDFSNAADLMVRGILVGALVVFFTLNMTDIP